MSKQEYIEMIEQCLHDKFHLSAEQVQEMLPNFLTALTTHLQNVDVALESGDLTELGRAGHTIKGALLNLGLNDCADIAKIIELNSKACDADTDFKGLVQELHKSLEPLVSE